MINCLTCWPVVQCVTTGNNVVILTKSSIFPVQFGILKYNFLKKNQYFKLWDIFLLLFSFLSGFWGLCTHWSIFGRTISWFEQQAGAITLEHEQSTSHVYDDALCVIWLWLVLHICWNNRKFSSDFRSICNRILILSEDEWMNEWCFRSQFYTVRLYWAGNLI